MAPGARLDRALHRFLVWGPPGEALHPEIHAVFHRLFAVGLTHVVGAVLVWVYLAVSFDSLEATRLDPDLLRRLDSSGFDLDGLVLIGLYLLLVSAVLRARGQRRVSCMFGWVPDRVRASDEERRRILALPWWLAWSSFVAWLGAAGLFGLVNVTVWDDIPRFVVHIVLAITLGGLTATALNYLFAERVLRPVFAWVLASGSPVTAPHRLRVRYRLLLGWGVGSGIPLLAIVDLVVVTRGEDVNLGPPAAFLAGVGLVAGGLMSLVGAKSVAEPLDSVRDGMRRLGAGDDAVDVPVDDGGEIGLLQDGFNRMVAGLRERRRLQDLFGRQVGEQVARLAIERGVDLEGEQGEASALFVDLVGSTALAQDRPAGEVVDVLNRFFTVVVEQIEAQGGYVSRFEGDGAICIFGAPVPLPDHASRALRAARHLASELDRRGIPAGIGVSSGIVVAGNVGTPQRYEYTVIGDPVNEAARLTEEAKAAGRPVFASDGAVSRADLEALEWAAGDEVVLRGRTSPTRVYVPSTVSVREHDETR